MNKKQLDLSKINYGFSLLKLLLAFEVVLGHFCNWKEYNTLFLWPFKELVSLAVPCFMIMSFYLATKSFLVRDDNKYKTRLYRLVMPQIGWAIIYWIVLLVLDVVFKSGIHVGISNLLWQLFTGHDTVLNPSMWYQIEIILITIVFYNLFKRLNNKGGYISIVVLMLACYALQYSGINLMLFKDLRFELKYPLGRIAEMIPYAVIGITLKYFDILEKLKKYRYIIMPLCVFLFLQGFNIAWYDMKDFGFSGLCKPYLAIWIILFAYYVPLEYLPDSIKRIILVISDYTLGIYCVHRLTNYLLAIFVPGLNLLSFEKCILIYILSYIICFLLSLVPNKHIKSLIN